MKKETIREYTLLYQYLLLLKEPLYIFLIQVFQHLSPASWWEDFIQPVLQRDDKENFKYLDIADLLNVFKMNWERVFRYLDRNYRKYKYDNEYRLVNKVHHIRTIVAHANETQMSPLVFSKSLAALLDFAKLVNAKENLLLKLEQDWNSYSRNLPSECPVNKNTGRLKEKILSLIEEKVLLRAINVETLPPGIKLSVDRTTLRLHSMRTIEEIMGFFNNAMKSKRGITVQDALHKHGLLAFEDIKDEVNTLYNTIMKSNT
jgi:hypothetical protein